MAATSLGTAFFDLVPSVRGSQRTIAKELGEEVLPAADDTGKKAGHKLSSGLMVGLGAAAAAGAGVAVAFKQFYNVGEIFDEVSDTIRVGTGATGEALAGLENDARRVATTVPTSFEQAGTVVADLNTRLGLSGETLQTVASQYLEAGRILGEDVDITATSAAFSAFKIEGDAVSGAMDTLFQVSQATGVGMNALASSAQAAAPAMNMLGFSFEETVGLVGMLDKAGMNSTQTMAAMQRSLVNLAKDGEEPADAFQRVIGELEGFIETGDTAAALDLAGKVFGTRGAPQFVAALESGTLATEDIMAAMGATGDTILGVGEETQDAAEKWQILKNNALDALEPIGTAVFGLVGDLLGALVPIAQEWGPKLGEALATAGDRFAPLFESVAGIFDELGPTLGELVPTVLQFVSSVSPLGILFKALQPVLPQVSAALKAVAATLSGALMSILPAVVQVAGMLAETLGTVLVAMLPVVVQLVAVLAQVFSDVLAALLPVVTTLIDALLPVVMALLPPLLELVSVLLPVLASLFAALLPVLNPLIKVVAAVLTPVLRVVGNVLVWLAGKVISPLIGWVAKLVTSMGNMGTSIKGAWDGMKNALSAAWTWIKDKVFSPIQTWVTVSVPGWFTSMKDRVSSNFSALKELLAAPWRWVRDNVFAKLESVVKGLPDAFRNAKESIKTAWNGIKAIAAAPVNFVIGTVYNDGIRATFNKLAETVGLSLRLPQARLIKFADGTEDHRAQIAPGGAMRLWAEPETGGEAYIPLAESKRGRSTAILGQVANRFGYRLEKYADGGFFGGVGNFFSSVGDVIGNVVDFLTDPVQGMKDLISAPMEKLLGEVTKSPLGQTLVELPRKVVTGLIDKAVALIRGDNESGFPGTATGWVRPSAGPITSRYGPRWGAFHAGIDIAGGGKTYAARAGKVMRTGNAILAGHTGLGILLDHGGGVQTYYGHNPVGGIQVAPGQFVRAGQHIGYQGATGNVTGVHLHFGLRKGGRMVNPEQTGLFDDGGWLMPGHAAVNLSNRPEPVFSGEQWDLLRRGSDGLTRDDLDYLADRLSQGLATMAKGAAVANDWIENGRLRARMAGGV